MSTLTPAEEHSARASPLTSVGRGPVPMTASAKACSGSAPLSGAGSRTLLTPTARCRRQNVPAALSRRSKPIWTAWRWRHRRADARARRFRRHQRRRGHQHPLAHASRVGARARRPLHTCGHPNYWLRELVDEDTGRMVTTCACAEGATCKSPGKHPILAGWPAESSVDHGQIDAWWAEHPYETWVSTPTGSRLPTSTTARAVRRHIGSSRPSSGRRRSRQDGQRVPTCTTPGSSTRPAASLCWDWFQERPQRASCRARFRALVGSHVRGRGHHRAVAGGARARAGNLTAPAPIAKVPRAWSRWPERASATMRWWPRPRSTAITRPASRSSWRTLPSTTPSIATHRVMTPRARDSDQPMERARRVLRGPRFRCSVVREPR